jgi:ABC-type lipoprotein export system ATPase subunit
MSASTGLSLLDVTRSYGAVAVLRGVSLDVAPGETVAIVGPSGSGKSTLLNIVGGLDTPDSGSVHVGAIAVHALKGKPLAAYRATHVGFVFQEHHLLPQLTALENVLLPTLAAAGHAAAPDRGEVLLDRVGVAARSGAFPSQMSGGERQRVAVARALVNAPRLLLCDEPTGNLDAANGSAIVKLLAEVAARDGVMVLMVTHNAEHAARFGRRFAMCDGRLEPADR